MPTNKRTRYTSRTLRFITKESEIMSISVSNACTKFNMDGWCDSILKEDDTLLPIPDAIIQASNSLQRKMAIETVEIDGKYMYGLIALEPIMEGESIIYGSKITSYTPDDMYKLQINSDKITSAKNFGNMARFMNHAPDNETVAQKLRFTSKNTLKNLATANFTGKIIHYNNAEYPILVANRKIKPGERLYWDYSMDYFSSLDCNILLFLKNGTIINPELYTWVNKRLQIKFNNELKDIGNFNRILKGNSIITLPVYTNGLQYNLVIHPDYIRNQLNKNPAINNNYFVNIQIPTRLPKYVKRISIESEINDNIIASLKEEILNIPNDALLDYEILTYRVNDVAEDSIEYAPFKYFILLPYDKITSQNLHEKCLALNIECFLDQDDKINISYADIFNLVKSATINELTKERNPFLTPTKRTSSTVVENTDAAENAEIETPHEIQPMRLW